MGKKKIKGVRRSHVSIYMDSDKADLITMIAEKFNEGKSELCDAIINRWLSDYFSDPNRNIAIPPARIEQILDIVEKETQYRNERYQKKQEEILKEQEVVEPKEEPKPEPVAEKMWDV